MAAKEQEWVALQRKIFSRWVKQKLSRRPDVQVNDIVADITDGNVLIALVEELSEKKYGGKKTPSPITMRIKQVENVGVALKFCWDNGVQMQVKPSAEAIVDKDTTSILGLIWQLYLTFIKIGEDEDTQKLNAKDALLMWCNNKCSGYANVGTIESFKKTAKSQFHNGIALCAIIHKHRPNLVPAMASLEAGNAIKNLEIAQDAAAKYFGLDKYITPQEITKLDEASMVIFASEFYYGIAEQKKIDLAARRIAKLIKLTQENDRLKAEYNKTAAEYKERLGRVEKTLGDRTIDDTLAGAKRRLDEFYTYKTADKNVLLANQLSLEGLFNNLAMRLAHHKRPEFIPPEGVSLRDVAAALKQLEVVEQERSIALQAELNRQLWLAKLAEQHGSIYENLLAWAKDKDTYLKTHPAIDSVSGAQLQIRLLEAFVKEAAATRESQLKHLHEIGEELVRERYENKAVISAHMADMDSRFSDLDRLATARAPVLQDDLARETARQATRLLYEEHVERHEALVVAWVNPKRTYLTKWDEVRSVAEARVQLSLLDAYDAELIVSGKPQLEALHAVGAKIIAAKHNSQYSTWEFEHTVTKEPPRDTNKPEERAAVQTHDSEMAAAFAELAKLAETKRKVLVDHLAREEFAERTRIIANTLADKFSALNTWLIETEASIASRPEVHSSNEARAELSLLSTLTAELERMASVRLSELTTIGKDLLGRKYTTELSSYSYEHSVVNFPQGDFAEPSKRAEAEEWLANAAKRFEECRQGAAKKKDVYEDHRKREEYAEETRVIAKQHGDQYSRLSAWVAVKETYLARREPILSISDVTSQLAILEAFDQEKKLVSDNDFESLKAVGKTLLARNYSTGHSSYNYEATKYSEPVYEKAEPAARAAIGEHETWVAGKLETLSQASTIKKAVLEDHLARETEAARVRMLGRQHDDMAAKVSLWMDRKEAYLVARTPIKCVADATTQLSLLARYRAEKEAFEGSNLKTLYELGQSVLAAKYASPLSSFSYDHIAYAEPKYDKDVPENRARLEEHLATAHTRWEKLGKLEAELHTVLTTAHQLELKKEQLRLDFAHGALSFTKWSHEIAGNLAIESFGLTLEEVQAHKASVDSSSTELKQQGNTRFVAVKGLAEELSSLHVSDNIYTTLGMGDVEGALKALVAAVEARDAAFAAELQRQIENDKLCQDFAKLADPFSKAIITTKDVISSSKEQLEAQLKHVVGQLAGTAAQEGELEKIKAVAKKMEERGITFNRHSTLTIKDVEVQWEQYKKFLEAKRAMLEQEIENAKLKGITVDQFKEIDEQFKKFDKDNSGDIDRKELTACLYSLGEERTSKEITAIMEQYASKPSQKVTSDAFKDLMIHILGDTDSKEEVLTGFQLINRGKPHTVKALMETVVQPSDCLYIEQTAPKLGEGNDYSAWVVSMFSR
jgi:hypothetical protein